MSQAPTTPRISNKESEVRMPLLREADVMYNRQLIRATLIALGFGFMGAVFAGATYLEGCSSDKSREAALKMMENEKKSVNDGTIPGSVYNYCWNYGKDQNENKAVFNYWLFPDNISRNVWTDPAKKVGPRPVGADFLLNVYEISTHQDVRRCYEDKVPGLKLDQ